MVEGGNSALNRAANGQTQIGAPGVECGGGEVAEAKNSTPNIATNRTNVSGAGDVELRVGGWVVPTNSAERGIYE